MKNNIHITLVFNVFIALITFSQQEYTIGFYNVENLFDTIKTPSKNDSEFLPSGNRAWNSKKYNEKISHINEVVITMNNPIILGFCEIENESVVRDIVKGGELKSTHGVVHFESLDQRGIDNAIVYDSTKLGLAESGIVRYDMPGNSSPSRDIVWGKFHCGTDTILVMVNHWPSRRGGQVESEPKRLVAAYAAKDFIDSVSAINPKIKIVFMGDLNDYPDNKGPQIIAKSLNPMISESSNEFGGSHNYRGEWHILDHIMVSNSFLKKKGMHVIKKTGVIHSDKYLLDRYKGNIVPFRTYGGRKYLGGYSDHLPVTVKFSF
ncbi:MAG: hypothetical protein MK105_08945 [Crocinitomicaceae bacterium]|nr:hypothetical protein [Crocinitomicaceae bacterium]